MFSTAISATSRSPSAPSASTHAYERTTVAGTPWKARTLPIDVGPVVVEVEAVAVALDGRRRQERRELLRDARGADGHAHRAVRRRERLVQVELAEVEAGVARPRDPEDAVRVRLVVVAEPAGVVDDLDDLGRCAG